VTIRTTNRNDNKNRILSSIEGEYYLRWVEYEEDASRFDHKDILLSHRFPFYEEYSQNLLLEGSPLDN
jgi:hypothetical protein